MLQEQGRYSQYFYLHHKPSGFCPRLFFLLILSISLATITPHMLTTLNSAPPVQISPFDLYTCIYIVILDNSIWVSHSHQNNNRTKYGPTVPPPQLAFSLSPYLFPYLSDLQLWPLLAIILDISSSSIISFTILQLMSPSIINPFFYLLIFLDSILFSLSPPPPLLYLRSLASLASNMVQDSWLESCPATTHLQRSYSMFFLK